MKMPKQLSKKIISIGMCTILLTAGGLATSTNISHARTINSAPAKLTNELWREEIKLEVSPKYSPLTKDYVSIYMIATEDDKVQLKFRDNVRLAFDYKFNDMYIFGDNQYNTKTRALTERNQWTVTNNRSGICAVLKDLVKKFNAEGIEVGDEVYMNGNRWPGTVRFSTDHIVGYRGNDYSKGYKSGKLDRWKSGFKLTRFGLEECSVNHLK